MSVDIRQTNLKRLQAQNVRRERTAQIKDAAWVGSFVNGFKACAAGVDRHGAGTVFPISAFRKPNNYCNQCCDRVAKHVKTAAAKKAASALLAAASVHDGTWAFTLCLQLISLVLSVCRDTYAMCACVRCM